MILLVVPFLGVLVYAVYQLRRDLRRESNFLKSLISIAKNELQQECKENFRKLLDHVERLPVEFDVKQIVEDELERHDARVAKHLEYLLDQVNDSLKRETQELAKIHKEKKI